MKQPHIVVVGSTNTDLVVDVPHLPAPGETVLGGVLRTVAGGKGANQAVAAARLGGRVTFVARIGDDAFGQNALAGFLSDGIDTSHVTLTPGTASGVALIPIDRNSGQNSIVVAPGANACLSPEDIDAAEDAIETADAVVISLEVPMDAVLRAAQTATAHDVPVILNPAPAMPLPASLLSCVSIFTPNETESRQILGEPSDESDPHALAARLLETGVGVVVLTLGAAGSVVATADGIERIPAFRAVAVDTVAAGDCFTGGLAVELARGSSLRDSVIFASAAASIKVTRHGSQAGLPMRAEVEAFLGKGR